MDIATTVCQRQNERSHLIGLGLELCLKHPDYIIIALDFLLMILHTGLLLIVLRDRLVTIMGDRNLLGRRYLLGH
jgi:hypothetical protein